MNLSLVFVTALQIWGIPFIEKNPLEGFDPLWKQAKFSKYNTAAQTGYLSNLEKEVIYILNLVRSYPKEFNETVVAKWPEYEQRKTLATNSYYLSLVNTLNTMQPMHALSVDSLCWVSAKCHAQSSGQKGYAGHDRLTEACEKASYFNGECCSYGYSSAIEIVMSLLLDENIPSLGHRVIMLRATYKGIGVSHQPHSVYGINTVLDFMD